MYFDVMVNMDVMITVLLLHYRLMNSLLNLQPLVTSFRRGQNALLEVAKCILLRFLLLLLLLLVLLRHHRHKVSLGNVDNLFLLVRYVCIDVDLMNAVLLLHAWYMSNLL